MLDLMLISLAALYAAYVVTSTSGPWHIFKRLRARLPLGGLLLCFICSALWASLCFVVLLQAGATLVVLTFAGAGGALFLWRYTGAANV